MPMFGSTPEPDLLAASTFSKGTASVEDKDFVTQYNTGLDKSMLASTAAATLGTVFDLADTVASSVIPGIERQQVNDKVLASIGSPGLSKWVNENKNAMEIGSGIAGTIIASWGAGKILNSGSRVMNLARQIPYVRSIAALDTQYANALRAARVTNLEAARRGAMGVDRFIGQEMSLAALGRPALRISSGQAAKAVRGAAITRGLAVNLATEGIMAATLHTNSMLYSDDLAHNLAWGAAGLGLGAAIDNLVGTYALRKIANSDQVRQANRKAFDPLGTETKRIHAFAVADEVLRKTGADSADLGWMQGTSGPITDRATSYAIQANELKRQPGSITERTTQLGMRREKLATPVQKMAMEEMNKVTVRGIRGIKGSAFGGDVEGLTKPINQSLYYQPESMYGIEELGTLPEGMTRVEAIEERSQKLSSRFRQIQDLLKNDGKWVKRKTASKGKEVYVDELVPLDSVEREALRAEALELHVAQSHTPVTMLEPGEWSPISWGQIADNYTPRKVDIEGSLQSDDLAIWTMGRNDPAEPRIGVSSQGDLFLPEGARGKLENLTPEESLHFYNVANKAVRDIAASGQTFMVPKNASWAVLDMAEQIIKQSGDASKVKFAGGLSREEALVESFAQKVDILKNKQRAAKIQAMRNLNVSMDDTKAFALKVQLNLPRLTPYEHGLINAGEHPIDILTHGLESGTQVRNMTYQDLVKAINDSREIVGLTDGTRHSLDALQGNSYNFLRDTEGNPMKPILGFKRPMRPMEWTRDELFMRQAMYESNVRNTLVGPDADPFNRALVDGLVSNPAFAQARKVMELADDQSRSFVPGFRNAAPQTTEGAFINALTTRDRRDVDNMGMRAASQIQEQKTRIVQNLSREMIDRHMGGLITDLTSARNSKSKMLADQFGSYRGGWELARKPREITLPDGSKGYAFTLDHESVLNQKRFEQAFGRALEKGQDFINPQGQAIVLDELAFRTLTAMQGVHEETLAMKNTLLRSQGLPEIKSTPWYWPPATTKDKYVKYTFDMSGEVVPGMTIIAETPSELAKMEADLVSSPQWKDGYRLRSQGDVQSFMNLWDKTQMEFVAPNTTAIQPKKANFGRTGGNQINTKAFEEALGTMLDSLLKHGDDVIDTLFDAPIKSARARAAVAKEATTVGSRKAVEHSSIYDRYLQNLTGRSSLSAKDSFWGEPYKWAEQRLNGFLASNPVMKAATVMDTVNDYLRVANPFANHQLPKETFEKFAKELGEYMPYKSVNEMIERQTGSKTPAEVAEITSKLSWFEATSRLRWFESLHAMVNFGSMVGNMPSVIRALQPMKGETVAEAALRNSNLSMLMHISDKESIIVPNTMGLVWQSMRDAQKSVPDEFTTKAIARGMMGQEVAEFQRAFNSIESRAGWRGFMFGDAGRTTDELSGPFKRARAKVADSGGLDKWLGLMTDKSEDFTRQWGMYAGRRVAESLGIHNVDAQLNFSHELVNQMIANYDPRNRAEIFQGALGAPLGLFQSYTVNFYQRMFRYIETGNIRALATQYATQGAIFGTNSLPGWNELNWAFFDHAQGENADPIESLQQRLGKDAADLMQYGVLSNLPKIFGANGMALYTRGDTQFRMPVNPLNMIKGDATISIPVTDTIGRIVGGIGQALGQLKAMDGKIGMNQLAEIASNVITNRPIAGFIETFGANGVDTDQSGQVVSRSVFPSVEAAYRILGTRSMAQQKGIEQFYASKNAQEEQSARKSQLNVATRQAIRDGRYDDLPNLFAKYVEQGGDPRQYTAWVKRAFDSATKTRDERMLEKALKDPNNQSNAYIGRLLDGEVDVAEDENNEDDYGQAAAMEQLINDGWSAEPDAELPESPDTTYIQ